MLASLRKAGSQVRLSIEFNIFFFFLTGLLGFIREPEAVLVHPWAPVHEVVERRSFAAKFYV